MAIAASTIPETPPPPTFRCASCWYEPSPRPILPLIRFTGDLVFNGDDANDWRVWDSETSVWREKNIPVYPALGNRDVRKNEQIAEQ